MGATTKIDLADYTSSPWKVDGEKQIYHAEFWSQCRKWNGQADGSVKSVAVDVDLFEIWKNEVLVDDKNRKMYRSFLPYCDGAYNLHGLGPPAYASHVRSDVFALIEECQNLIFLLRVSRPLFVLAMWPQCQDVNDTCATMRYFNNVALVASVSDQASADELIPDLLGCRDLCKYLGVSAEPLVGPVDLGEWLCPCDECNKCIGECGCKADLDLCIIGGESGPNARPCNVEDIRSLVAQCRAAEVPCFVKQLGQSVIVRASEDFNNFGYVDSNHNDDLEGNYWLRLRDPKGGNPEEWPEDLRVRELPWRKDTCPTS